MSQTDPRAVAKELSKKLRDAVMRAPIDIDAAEAMEIPLLHALADAERVGMELGMKKAAEMIRKSGNESTNPTVKAIFCGLANALDPQAQADKEG